MLWTQVMVITRWIHSPKDEIVTFVANYFGSIGSNTWHFKDNVNVVFKFPSVRNTFFNSPNSKSTCLQEFFFVIMNQLFSSRSTSLDPLVSAKPRMWVGQKVHCFFWVWSFYVRPSPCLKLLCPNDWQRISNPHRSLELHHSTSASMTSNKDLFFFQFFLWSFC